jgi:hypothetical protein
VKAFQSPPPRIDRADVPLTTLQRRIRELVARQRQESAGLADRSAERLTTVLAPTQTTPEESQP